MVGVVVMVGVAVDTYALVGIRTLAELRGSEYRRSEKRLGAINGLPLQIINHLVRGC